MADDELRELERRYRASSVIDDGATWHRARLRAGVVDLEGLRREAADGDGAAWRAADPPSVLVRLDAWLRAHAPEQLAGFNPPATDEQIAATEVALGRPLPTPLRALYQWRNGQPPEPLSPSAEVYEEQALGFPPDPPGEDTLHLAVFPRRWRLLSLDELVRARVVLQAVESLFPPDCLPFMLHRRQVKAQHVTYRARCVDLGGVGTGQSGQLVEGFLYGALEEITAPSLLRWLEVVVAALEQAAWTAETSGYRYDYFERAVNPGYPLDPRSDSPSPVPPPLSNRRARVRSDFVSCFQLLLVLGFIPAICPVPALIAASGVDGVGWFLLAPLLLIPCAALVALVLTVGIYLYDDRRHERYTTEFADATLAPQDAG